MRVDIRKRRPLNKYSDRVVKMSSLRQCALDSLLYPRLMLRAFKVFTPITNWTLRVTDLWQVLEMPTKRLNICKPPTRLPHCQHQQLCTARVPVPHPVAGRRCRESPSCVKKKKRQWDTYTAVPCVRQAWKDSFDNLTGHNSCLQVMNHRPNKPLEAIT